ncbi:hypothetical protein N9E53_08485 [Amylibacter sp.]|jgi:hypothetical protein|nr:hypothetical protein [Amylibacter sp.]|tara:strand:+ start:283 stop:1044 length:762 start_codon:yes stop_codon:yes gene_type:complete
MLTKSKLKYLLITFLIGIPTLVLVSYLGDDDRITGVWSYKTDKEAVSIAIKTNGESFMAFRLSGPAQLLTDKMESWGKSQVFTDPFKVSDDVENLFFSLPVRGTIQVPHPSKSDGSTIRKEVVVRLKAELIGEALSLDTEAGEKMLFNKTNFLNYLFEYLKLVLSTIASFIIFIIAGILYLKLFINRFKAISKLKIDRRYSSKGGAKFRGGKTGNSELFWLIAGTVVVFVIYFRMLGYLKIGGFTDHVGFWIY